MFDTFMVSIILQKCKSVSFDGEHGMHFFANVRPEALSGAQTGNVSGRTRGASLLRLQQGLPSRAVPPKRVEETSGGLKARIGSDDLGLLDPNPLGDLLKVFLPQ